MEYINIIYTIIALSVATAVVSVTITRSKIFRGLRLFLEDKNEWLHKLFTCPYCMSHWVAVFFVVMVRPTLSLLWGWEKLSAWVTIPMEIIVGVFVVVGFATLVSALLQRVNPFAGDHPPPEEDEEEEEDNSSTGLGENWNVSP
jgi:uncharacterized membrane protein YphA (DoxX/SURF4 family)